MSDYEPYIRAINRCETYVGKLEAAIRAHRDAKGDDRCWMDDEELYRVLPEGYEAPKRAQGVELANCITFLHRRFNPGTEYISPQRRIEELETEVRRLNIRIEHLGGISDGRNVG